MGNDVTAKDHIPNLTALTIHHSDITECGKLKK
jgi:hypothetical protein